VQDKQIEFSMLVGHFLSWIYLNQSWGVVLGEVYRPQFVQEKYFEEGKTKTKNSYHTKSLAIDLTLFIDGVYKDRTEDYRPLGEYWESLDPKCVWGGRFGDNPNTPEIEGWDGGHFQFG